MPVVVEVYAESRKLQLKRTSGVLYSNNFATLETLSDIACVDVCINTRLCLTANYNTGTRTCALINDLQVFVTNVNWHAYSVITGTVGLDPLMIIGSHITFIYHKKCVYFLFSIN